MVFFCFFFFRVLSVFLMVLKVLVKVCLLWFFDTGGCWKALAAPKPPETEVNVCPKCLLI